MFFAFGVQAAEQKQVFAELLGWDAKLQSLSADYEQKTVFEGMEISASSGRIYKKGGKIRLDTLAGGAVTQSAVTDKKIIKILDGAGKLVTSLPWADWQAGQANKALFDFGNYAAVLDEHSLKEFSEIDGGYLIILTPNEGPKYDLAFVLDAKDCFPKEVAITSEGVTTTTALKNINKNPKLKENLFK